MKYYFEFGDLTISLKKIVFDEEDCYKIVESSDPRIIFNKCYAIHVTYDESINEFTYAFGFFDEVGRFIPCVTIKDYEDHIIRKFTSEDAFPIFKF